MITNFDSLCEDELAEVIAESFHKCNYCSYYLKNECYNDPRPCAKGIRKWFDEEFQYDD